MHQCGGNCTAGFGFFQAGHTAFHFADHRFSLIGIAFFDQRIDQIPQRMKDALLAVEDARFYEHGGVDPISVARAAVSIASFGLVRRVQGGSTITPQVARTFLLTRERTLSRKIKEAILSLRIETALSKDQILELYMNQIYLGSRAYGFEAAAQAHWSPGP